MNKTNMKDLYKHIDRFRDDGLTWREVKEELNEMYDLKFDESAYRKPYQAYKQGIEDSISDAELQLKLQEIRKKKKALSMERSINNAQIRDLASQDVITEAISQSVKRKNSIDLNMNLKGLSYKSGIYEHVVFLSDLHYDGHDFDELVSKFEKITSEVIDFCHKNKKSHIYIAELGDVIEGSSLRVSQLQLIKKGMIEQIVDVARVYETMLETIAKEGIEVYFHTVTSSNHTQLRPLGTNRNELVTEDLMILFHKYLDRVFGGLFEGNPYVHVIGSKELDIRIGDNVQIHAEHGHVGNVRPNNLQSVVSDIIAFRGSEAKHFVFGHFHHYEEKTLNYRGDYDKKAFILPSLSGKESSYEEDRRMGNRAGYAIMCFNIETGHHDHTKHMPL